MNWQFHPVSEIFPLMQGRDLDELAEDIRKNGLLEPIWTHENKIIDGRNRYRACEKAGIVPGFRPWDGESSSLVAFVVSLNLKRRHLDESQRAMVAAKLANLPHGGDYTSETPIGVSLKNAAEMMNIGARTADRARSVVSNGVPELAVAVERGEISVSAASQFTDFSPEAQREAIDRIQAGEKPSIVKRDLSPLMSSISDEWNTPPKVVAIAESVLSGIDLDPCCNDGTPNVPAKKVFRRKDDGLKHPWKGKIYMNPPYGEAVGDWIEKLTDEYRKGNTKQAIALVAARVDTKWFRKLEPHTICFISGRLKFGSSDNSATFPSAAIYLGENPQKFIKEFSGIGWFPNMKKNG